MNRSRQIILIIGFLFVLLGIWAYPKISLFLKVDNCLDKGGRWNYETGQCETKEGDISLQKRDRLKDYNPFEGEESGNVVRLKKTIIINPTVDTTELFKIWTLDPNGVHADFWFKAEAFYVVDYDGNGAMPYLLNRDSLTIFYENFVQKGKIISVSKDTLKIHWNKTKSPIRYVEWKD